MTIFPNKIRLNLKVKKKSEGFRLIRRHEMVIMILINGLILGTFIKIRLNCTFLK